MILNHLYTQARQPLGPILQKVSCLLSAVLILLRGQSLQDQRPSAVYSTILVYSPGNQDSDISCAIGPAQVLYRPLSCSFLLNVLLVFANLDQKVPKHSPLRLGSGIDWSWKYAHQKWIKSSLHHSAQLRVEGKLVRNHARVCSSTKVYVIMYGSENSKFKPGLLDHFGSIFIKAEGHNIFNSLLAYFIIFKYSPMPNKMLRAGLPMISTLGLNVKL